jgi:hypothetical protein
MRASVGAKGGIAARKAAAPQRPVLISMCCVARSDGGGGGGTIACAQGQVRVGRLGVPQYPLLPR